VRKIRSRHKSELPLVRPGTARTGSHAFRRFQLQRRQGLVQPLQFLRANGPLRADQLSRSRGTRLGQSRHPDQPFAKGKVGVRSSIIDGRVIDNQISPVGATGNNHHVAVIALTTLFAQFHSPNSVRLPRSHLHEG